MKIRIAVVWRIRNDHLRRTVQVLETEHTVRGYAL